MQSHPVGAVFRREAELPVRAVVGPGHRFGEVLVEPGGARTASVFILTETSDRDEMHGSQGFPKDQIIRELRAQIILELTASFQSFRSSGRRLEC